MKKTIVVISLLIGINLYATYKAKCEELFRSAISNFYLENSCKFDKHLSSAIRKKFGNQNCTEMFSDDDMKKYNTPRKSDSFL